MAPNMTSTTGAIEEEKFPDYRPELFYPAHIGEVIKSPRTNYKIIGKLGYGKKSAVWLCLDLSDNTYYTIKINAKHLNGGNREAAIYEHLKALGSQHIGVGHVRKLHEAFELSGPDGQHYCLVHPPMGISIDEYQETFPGAQYPNPILKPLLCCLFKALDLLHSEAGVIHSDIQAQTSSSPSTPPLPSSTSPPQRKRTQAYAKPSTRAAASTPPAPSPTPSPRSPSPVRFRTRGESPTRRKAQRRLAWGAEADIWNLGALTWKLA
ncbi:hypothetical protein V496_05902 [Pseudogymnoascus sp. VKM F-4515 (FW-2607)]|nr:hypothetical protein V496_05902 [Pseudogymnoascus sp. VKM F-4515 (FW-2607)]